MVWVSKFPGLHNNDPHVMGLGACDEMTMCTVWLVRERERDWGRGSNQQYFRD